MSSDESDHETARQDHITGSRAARYHVLTPAWRAKELTSWLHIFDAAYIIMCRTGVELRSNYP